jgi:2-succinyl-6-hydroxy-2,4-cyclohexadiene-1-carboxylate synthase
MKVNLNCLHGFFGGAQDWENLFTQSFESFRALNLHPHCVEYDLFSPGSKADPALGLSELGTWVNKIASAQASPRVLLGYSLGGRIALHALLQSPENWAGAIIVSAHPGFRSSDDTAQGSNDANSPSRMRINADEVWAKKFEAGSWSDVVSEWNSQAVLRSAQNFEQLSHESRLPLRLESDFSRMRLANSLRFCSLGRQKDLRKELRQLSVPILWISGEQDAKYRALAQEAEDLNPLFQSVVIPGGAHRVPWENPRAFMQVVVDYLSQLKI